MDPQSKKPAGDDSLWQEVQNARNADIAKLAQLLWGENSKDLEEPEALAIGDTVLNRIGAPGRPTTLQDVLNQPKQYSPFDPADPNYSRTTSFAEGHPYYSKYLALAQKIMDPARQRSPYTHYFSAMSAPPAWAKGLESVTPVGRHIFGKERKPSEK